MSDVEKVLVWTMWEIFGADVDTEIMTVRQRRLQQ